MNFGPEFFSGNRQKLIEATDAELIVVAANGLLQRSADTVFPFRQDSNFWYLTGVEQPDFVLVLLKGSSFLIAPARAEHRDMWDGAVDAENIKYISGVDEVMEHHNGWNKLDRLIKQIRVVHTITPAEPYFNALGFYANPARGALLAALNKHRSLVLVDIRKDIAHLRQVKQQVELAAIQKAIDITTKTLIDVQKKLKLQEYDYENEVATDITAGFLRLGAEGHAYQPIVAAGRNAATIHYIANTDSLADGGFLLCDVGAEVTNYSADITRTYALGPLTAREKAVYGAVKRVHQYALKQLKPGVKMKPYEQAVDERMAQELHKLGLLDDLENKRQLKKYYPHLTSHFLGLDTHDSADYERPLQEGMVLTVEPGIYIPEEGIGVRIEDDVLITKTGVKVLSAGLPSSLV